MLQHLYLCLALFILAILERKRLVSLEPMYIHGKVKYPKNPFYRSEVPFICIIIVTVIFRLCVNAYWGVDAKEYEEIYYEPAKKLNFIDIFRHWTFASMYLIFSKAVTFFSWNYWSYRFFLCTLYILVCAWYIRKYSKHEEISFVVFYAVASGQLLLSYRQMLAYCFLLISYHLIMKKKYICATLLAVIAVYTHTIALAGLGVYLLIPIKKRFNLIQILIIMIIAYIFSSKVIGIIIRAYRFGMYNTGDDLTNSGTTLLLVQFVILFFYNFVIVLKKIKSEKIAFYYNNYVIACALQFFALHFSTFNRVRLFYLMGLALLSGEVLDYMNNSFDKKVYKVVVVLAAMLFYLYTFAKRYPFISVLDRVLY